MRFKANYLLLLLIGTLFGCGPAAEQQPDSMRMGSENPGSLLVQEVINKMGGLERWRALQDIEYTYTYRNPATGKQDVSLERYVYADELSWAKYQEHTQSLMPEEAGEIIQGFDGDTAWITLEGQLLTEQPYIDRAHFSRKTNFYWLNMMFKLLDPGVAHQLLEDQELYGHSYHRVKVTFGDHVGDVQDTYLLYVNPDTKLVDYFLFTVMAFGRSEPLLTRVEYGQVDGLMFPVSRRYAPSNWDGQVAEAANWMEALSADFKINSGFSTAMFQQPDN